MIGETLDLASYMVSCNVNYRSSSPRVAHSMRSMWVGLGQRGLHTYTRVLSADGVPQLGPLVGLDKLCFYFNLLCFSVMLITCAYYAFKVNLLCSIMLQKLINNDGKYSQIYNCLYQSNQKQKESYYRHCHLYQKVWDQSFYV